MLVRYLIALVVFLTLDMLWLGVLAKDFYQKQIGHLLSSRFSLLPAATFYLIFVAGLLIFVISPALEKRMWTHALVYGALFGLVTYAAYDLTNMATLKDWPLTVTIVDLVWGATLSASVSLISYQVITRFFS